MSSMVKLEKILSLLLKGNASTNAIARNFKADRRTIQKILNVALRLKLVNCQKLETGSRTYSNWSINPQYQLFWAFKEDNSRYNPVKYGVDSTEWISPLNKST